MKIILTNKTTLQGIADHLSHNLPQYIVQAKKVGFNNLVEVQKSGWVGVWVRYNEKKDKVTLQPCIPSTLNRVLFGGLLLIIINAITTRKMLKEVADAINNPDGTNLFGR